MSRHLKTCKPRDQGQEEESIAAQSEESKDEVVQDDEDSFERECGDDNPAAIYAIGQAQETKEELLKAKESRAREQDKQLRIMKRDYANRAKLE